MSHMSNSSTRIRPGFFKNRGAYKLCIGLSGGVARAIPPTSGGTYLKKEKQPKPSSHIKSVVVTTTPLFHLTD